MVADDLGKQQHLLREIEQAVRLANQEVIHQHIASISRDDMLALAVAVAGLRARYLDAAFAFVKADHGHGADDPHVATMRERRLAYEEGVQALEALTRAIELEYVKVEGL